MGVVLGKAADAEQAVESPVKLVAVNQAQFSHPHGEIAVAVYVALVDEDAAGAVHRLNRVRFVVNRREIHVVAVMIPVTGLFPQVAAQDCRRADFVIFRFVMQFIPEFEQRLAENHAFCVEEREARAFFVEAEQVELLAQFTMVALFRFSQHVQICVQVVFLFKSRAVNTLEHLIVFIAAPVRAGNGQQLEGFDPARRFAVRSCAQIDEIALAV